MEQIRKCRQVGVPIVLVNTSDDFQTLQTISKSFNGKQPILAYDCVAGLQAVNELGTTLRNYITEGMDETVFTDAVTCLEKFKNNFPNPESPKENFKSIFVILGAQRILDDKKVQQAITNLRNPFKDSNRTLILLASLGTQIPADLNQDILQIEDQVPNDEERADIINNIFISATEKKPAPEILKQAIAGTKGLSAYACEQAVALSFSKEGFDTNELRKRWKQTINNTPGLSIDESGMTLNDIGGLDAIKEFAKRLMNGRNAPSVVVRVEEIEKAVAGAGYASGGVGDSSGTSQGIMQALLTHMQEENCSGIVAIGSAGTGKSLCSVAIGSAGNIPTITFDLNALKGSLVGQSEANTRRALSTLKALAGKNSFWIASCNSSAALPPELQRRFSFGRWYFDLPSNEEKEPIWKIHLKKYPDVKDERPDDTGWTGAEIKTCCEMAYRMNCSLIEAAGYIVPVSRMAAESLENLRKQADGRYLSANKCGIYKKESTTLTGSGSNRKMMLEE